MSARAPSPRLGLPATLSLVMHGSLVVAAIMLAGRDRVALPPVYKVDLVAAPAGPRAIGEVTPSQAPTPPPETPTPPPRRAEAPSTAPPTPSKTAPRRVAPRATPVPNPAKSTPRDAPAQKAGGGDTGGAGTDVANVAIEGIAFPYPSYLQNIVRQIALRFKPRPGTALSAEMMFLIRRDGTVDGFSFRRRSGSYAFDLEAQGAVEAAARAGSFGPLPDGFSDDILPVIFSFDPQLIR